MSGSLCEVREATPDDLAVINMMAAREGMDHMPSLDNIYVATNTQNGDIVGFIRLAFGDACGVWYVNPIVVYDTWRGYGVGRLLMEYCLAKTGELRLISRGSSVPFYTACGYIPIPWDDIDMSVTDDCDHCPYIEQCAPVPMGKRLDNTCEDGACA